MVNSDQKLKLIEKTSNSFYIYSVCLLSGTEADNNYSIHAKLYVN